MADSLAAVQQLDAADPRQPRTEERRTAFVAASARCIQTDVLSATADRSTVVEPASAAELSNQARAELEDANASSGSAEVTVALSSEESRAKAIATLVGQGRSPENATCIVERLELLEADFLFSDPNLGLGLDPLEANAMASCI